uniref:RdRp n=1 Tax=Hubei picobirna-like virus 1 TaxID=1923084 RepID=A0A1L3KLX3_9VIRU|nr:RdRp [Hubei picobirna-like virus 1]
MLKFQNKIRKELLNMMNKKVIMDYLHKLNKLLGVSGTSSELESDETSFKTLQSYAFHDPLFLPLKPIAASMSEVDGYEDGNKVPLDSKTLLWEKSLLEFLYAVGLKYYGLPKFDYSLANEDEYERMDYWVNFRKQGRLVTPNATKSRLEALAEYKKPPVSKLTWKQPNMVDVMNMLSRIFGRNIFLNPTPKGSIPFQKKNTNVGYPYFKNSKTKASKDGPTYAQICLNDAKSLVLPNYTEGSGMNWPSDTLKSDQQSGYDWSEGLKEFKFDSNANKYVIVVMPKMKDSKSRLIIAAASTATMPEVMMVLPMMGQLAQSPVFMGYKSTVELVAYLKKLYKAVSSNEKWMAFNLDWSGFDMSVTKDEQFMAALVINEILGNDKAKNWFAGGAANMINAPMWNYDPGSDTKQVMYNAAGRIMSGNGKTNVYGGMMNAMRMEGALFNVSSFRSSVWSLFNNHQITPLSVMGDDALVVLTGGVKELMSMNSAMTKMTGMDRQSPKDAMGIFFLQQSVTGKGWSSPSVSYFSKLFWSETKPNLGPFLTCMAQLSLIENFNTELNPEKYLLIWTLYKLDKFGLHINVSVDTFRNQLAREALAIGNQTVMSLMWDGDPMKEDRFDNDENVSSKWLKNMRRLIDKALEMGKAGKFDEFKPYLEKYYYKSE